MRRLICCTGKSKRRTEMEEEARNSSVARSPRGPNSGAQQAEQPSSSNPSASATQPQAEEIGGNYTFEQLSEATEGFNDRNLCGSGGFGDVYVGIFQNPDQRVAIKRLHGEDGQGVNEFNAEVEVLNRTDHPNLVKSLGYCIKGNERLLVFEYLPLRSLDYHLFDTENHSLDWQTRMKIAIGTAKGLRYLHEDLNIIHRDIKDQNVLLNDDFVPKLSDFGLAKDGPTGRNRYIKTRVVGTEGYTAPEFESSGKLTFAADVYSFGVLLLVILTGQKAAGLTNLADLARTTWKSSRSLKSMVDPSLQDYPEDKVHKYSKLVMSCINEDPFFRPDIRKVRRRLKDIDLNLANSELNVSDSDSDEEDHTVAGSSGLGRMGGAPDYCPG